MKDFYGNPQQSDTPTTILLEKRKQKLESDGGLFHFRHKQYPDMTKEALVALLRKVAEIVADADAEQFRVELLIEQVKEK